MKIGIYARGLSEKVGGVKQYIESMTKAIIEYIDDDTELYIFHNCKNNQFTGKRNVREVILKSSNKMICDHILAPYYINKLKLDVVWFPKNVIPFFVKAKRIVTIHDLAYFLPEYNAYPIIDTIYMKTMMKSSCKRADRIIAVSENTKKDIVRLLDIPEKKIEVIYEAADEKYRIIKDKKELERVRKKYNLNKKFILFTGGISPRKNLVRLINAFNHISDQVPHDLVLTGGGGSWNNSKELELIKSNEKIKRIGYVSDKDMPYLYNLADIYVYPSLYEGFGLPVLEAHACGCPVIASKVASIEDIGGKGVLYVNPYNLSDVKGALLKALQDENHRNKLVKENFKNVKRFCWNKSSAQLLEIIGGMQHE